MSPNSGCSPFADVYSTKCKTEPVCKQEASSRRQVCVYAEMDKRPADMSHQHKHRQLQQQVQQARPQASTTACCRPLRLRPAVPNHDLRQQQLVNQLRAFEAQEQQRFMRQQRQLAELEEKRVAKLVKERRKQERREKQQQRQQELARQIKQHGPQQLLAVLFGSSKKRPQEGEPDESLDLTEPRKRSRLFTAPDEPLGAIGEVDEAMMALQQQQFEQQHEQALQQDKDQEQKQLQAAQQAGGAKSGGAVGERLKALISRSSRRLMVLMSFLGDEAKH